MSDAKFDLVARANSFRYAGRGIWTLLRTQHNAWIHAAATLAVCAAAVWLNVSRLDWVLLVLAMGAVWAAEGFNTAIEQLADVVSTEHHAGIGRAKDVAAGAVLLSAIASAIVGVLVLGPPLLEAIS
jgi:diacylglycerol kinase (ATP)